MFNFIKEMFFPKQDTWVVKHSELSNPKAKQYKQNSGRDITKKILEENIEARDDKEYFMDIIKQKAYKDYSIMDFSTLESYSRNWRYIQQHYPELRGKNWEKRHRLAKEVAKTF